MGSSGRPYLAQSLSAVAIAALDGVVPVLGTATGEVVRHLVARYSATPELRGLHRRTTTAVLRWAEAEGLSEVEQGLSLATRAVGRYGLTHEQIAQERFDSVRVAARVLADAQGTDPDWGRRGFWRQRVPEDRHIVAERAVHEIYAALIGELRADEPVVLPALAVVLDDVGRLRLDLCDAAQDLGELRDALVRGATAGEVMAYLRTRIVDWDSPVWSGMVPSSIERRLTANTVGSRPGAESQDLTEQEALEHQEMLVVLGGPGSGKTWLARRYARNAAREALARLEAGANLYEVEIPLFTTWDQWAQTAGPGTRETLVTSSFDPVLGHSDIAGHDLSGQLQRTLVLAETQVLLIVDSLDEAADRENQNNQGNRLHSLASLRGERCRVVVTSRPSAWDSVRGRVPSSDSSLRVVSLHELRTDDVEEFVEAWFATDTDRAQALIQQLRDRPDLARAAVVPLILTFYCSIAGEGQPAEVRTLPVRRHALYARIVRRTFHHVDSSKGAGAVARDPEERMKVLAAWAWHAVGNANISTGLGNWGDTFTQPPGAYDDPALDAIAPKVRVDDEGVVTRRFQHRTLLEHFVAEYVAELPTDEAAEILFPHLWYDPDWAVAAPAAIAAHNRRRPGELLGEICDDFAAYRGTTSTAWMQISRELDRQLVVIAVESDPDEWVDRDQDILNSSRSRHATSTSYSGPAWRPRLIDRSAHWERSNAAVVAKVLDLLSDADVWTSIGLAEMLPSLSQSLDDRALTHARGVVLEMLPARNGYLAASLAETLVVLAPSHEDRERARSALVSQVNPIFAGSVVGAFVALGPSTEERTKVLGTLLQALASISYAGSTTVDSLVQAFLMLDPSAHECERARAALLSALPNVGFAMGDMVRALLVLEPTSEDRTQAWATALEALRENYHLVRADGPVEALLALRPSADERAQARALVLAEMSDAPAVGVAMLVQALVSMGPTADDRLRAVAVALGALSGVRAFDVPDLVGALLALGPTVEERERARAVVLAELSASPYDLDNLVKALLALGPTFEERESLRAVLLAELPARPYLIDHLVGAFLALGPTVEERQRVRAAALAELRDVGTSRTDSLVEALLALDPSVEERAQARVIVLSALQDADDIQLDRLVGSLLALGPDRDERALAWGVVLGSLADRLPYAVDGLVALLERLRPSASDLGRERAQAVEGLSKGHDQVIVTLAAGLRRIYTLPDWLDLLSDVPADPPQPPTT